MEFQVNTYRDIRAESGYSLKISPELHEAYLSALVSKAHLSICFVHINRYIIANYISVCVALS